MGKTIIVNIPKMFSIAILEFQNSKQPRGQVRNNSKKCIVVI
jgi:hypothetical protein